MDSGGDCFRVADYLEVIALMARIEILGVKLAVILQP
jgi:hypothetical protein